jgi:hypothetical protein
MYENGILEICATQETLATCGTFVIENAPTSFHGGQTRVQIHVPSQDQNEKNRFPRPRKRRW